MRKIGIVTLCLLAIYGLARAADVENPFRPPAVSCTNQFIRSIAVLTGVGACATVGTSDLAASLALTTPNIGAATATSLTFGGATLSTYTATTWTPTITGSSTAGTGQTYSIQVGSYEQIGRQVTLRFNIAASSFGTATGNAQISGFPVASANVVNDVGTCAFGFTQIAGTLPPVSGLTGLINANTSFAVIFSNAGVSSSLTLTQLGAGELTGICWYHT